MDGVAVVAAALKIVLTVWGAGEGVNMPQAILQPEYGRTRAFVPGTTLPR